MGGERGGKGEREGGREDGEGGGMERTRSRGSREFLLLFPGQLRLDGFHAGALVVA